MWFRIRSKDCVFLIRRWIFGLTISSRDGSYLPQSLFCLILALKLCLFSLTSLKFNSRPILISFIHWASKLEIKICSVYEYVLGERLADSMERNLFVIQTATQILRNIRRFYGTRISSPCSKAPTTDFCPIPDQSSPYHSKLFLWDSF